MSMMLYPMSKLETMVSSRHNREVKTTILNESTIVVHCVKSVYIWSYLPVYMQENTDRNNFEYRNFSRSVSFPRISSMTEFK